MPTPSLSHAPRPTSASLPPARRPRRSPRFLPEPLSPEAVGGLLRATFAPAAPACWGRAAPSPLHWRRIAVYALAGDGVYRGDPAAGRAERVLAGDLRVFARPAREAAHGGIELVYVADFATERDAHREEHGQLAGSDAGCMVEAVQRHCAARGLAAIVRPHVDRRRLAAALGLEAGQWIVRVQSVGRARHGHTHASLPVAKENP